MLNWQSLSLGSRLEKQNLPLHKGLSCSSIAVKKHHDQGNLQGKVLGA